MPVTVKLRPMVVADMQAPPNFWDGGASVLALLKSVVSPGKGNWPWLPIPAFVAEHPARGPILIDTAFDASVATDPAQSLGGVPARIYRIRMEAEQAVPAQLRTFGIDPGDVELVVMTHLHYDHTSGIAQFPDAEYVVEFREHEAAVTGGFFQGYMPRHLDAADNWRLVDVAGAPPADGFEHVLDVLGDGSIRLAFTPGHTHGHCSVLVETDGGPVLLTGDAAYARKSIDERLVPLLLTGKKDEYLHSLDHLDTWAQAHPDSPVICGHDPWGRADLERDY